MNLIGNAVFMAAYAGALFGFFSAAFVVSLNTLTLKSFRSMAVLAVIMSVIYAGIFILPGAAAYAVCAWIWSERTAAAILMAGVGALALGLVVNQSRVYAVLWRKSVRNAMVFSAMVFAASMAAAAYFTVRSDGLISWRTFIPVLAPPLAMAFLWSTERAAKGGGAKAEAHDGGAIEVQRREGDKIIVFGIDSATWEVMRPLVEDGSLPTIAGLARKGCTSNLKTMVPTFSPILWTSIATGKVPLKHGIRDFLVTSFRGMREEVEVLPRVPLLKKAVSKLASLRLVARRPVDSNDRKCHALWNILSDVGYRVGVTSWFVNDPAEVINGVMIPEFFYMIGKKERDECTGIHPPEAEDGFCRARADVSRRLHEDGSERELAGMLNIPEDLHGVERVKLDILKDFYYQDVLRERVTYMTCERNETDVLMVYFHGVDAAQHHFWLRRGLDGDPFKDAIVGYYKYMDRILANILKLMAGRQTVIVISDHGHGPLETYKRLLITEMRRNALEGSHSRGEDGVFIASGWGIREGVRLEDATLCDIAPTILALLGLPVADDMDGRVLKEMFSGDVPPVRRIDTYEGKSAVVKGKSKSLEEDEVLMKRLRDLGYME